MSYPQPQSDEYALTGYDFFRLNTPLTSPGDLYESTQSGHAFALGPNSDVANVNIGYFDDQVQTFLNQVTIGPNRSWIGRLNARNDATYTPSARPGRLLMWPADLYDPQFRPTGFNILTDSLAFITPVMDVIQYFKPQNSLDILRNDKTYRIQELSIPTTTAFTVIPYWSRKYANALITNLTTGDVQFTIWGVNYFMNDTFQAIEVQLDTATVATLGQHQTIINAATDGVFDALLVGVTAATANGPTPIQLTVSDSAA